jgi:maltose-binding protein MalE
MKRIFAVLVLVGVVAAGAGVAWAQTAGSGERAARRQALRTCVQQAKQDHPDATKEELKPIVKSCLEAQGITRRFTPEQKEQAKACIDQAKAANPDADRATILHAARPCLEQAGLVKPLTPEQQARRAKLLACFEQAKADHAR